MMSKTVIIGGGIFAFLALCVLCATCHGPELQQALAPTVKDYPSLAARVSAGNITLRGILPDEKAKASVVTDAQKIFGQGNVIDSLKVQSTVSEAVWLRSMSGLFGLLRHDARNAGFAIKNSALTVDGIVKNAEAKQALLASARTIGGGLSILDNVDVESAVVQRDINTFLMGKTVQFKTGSAELLPGGKVILDTVAMLLSQAPDVRVEVGGHTDNQGNEKANLVLSESRARATRMYLVGKNIERERLSATGYGQMQPVASNDTPEGRQRNRRIQFTVK